MKDTLNLTGAVNGFQLKPDPLIPITQNLDDEIQKHRLKQEETYGKSSQ